MGFHYLNSLLLWILDYTSCLYSQISPEVNTSMGLIYCKNASSPCRGAFLISVLYIENLTQSLNSWTEKTISLQYHLLRSPLLMFSDSHFTYALYAHHLRTLCFSSFLNFHWTPEKLFFWLQNVEKLSSHLGANFPDLGNHPWGTITSLYRSYKSLSEGNHNLFIIQYFLVLFTGCLCHLLLIGALFFTTDIHFLFKWNPFGIGKVIRYNYSMGTSDVWVPPLMS